MEGFSEQKNTFEINDEQKEVVAFLNFEMEEMLSGLGTTSADFKKIDDFLNERSDFQVALEKEGVNFKVLYLWHVLVGGTIQDSMNIEAFDTPDKKIEQFFKQKLLPIIKRGK